MSRVFRVIATALLIGMLVTSNVLAANSVQRGTIQGTAYTLGVDPGKYAIVSGDQFAVNGDNLRYEQETLPEYRDVTGFVLILTPGDYTFTGTITGHMTFSIYSGDALDATGTLLNWSPEVNEGISAVHNLGCRNANIYYMVPWGLAFLGSA